MAVGEGRISGTDITLSAEAGAYSVADMGTRPASMSLECDVTIDGDGCAGFAFGGSEKDAAYTALCLDAGQNRPLDNFDNLNLTPYRSLPDISRDRSFCNRWGRHPLPC